MPINSRSKGQRGEREIVKILQELADVAYGKDAVLVERNQNQSNKGGYDLVGINWLSVEVKFCEQFHLDQWWEQCYRQAKEGQIPVLFYRRSRIEWRVRMLARLIKDKPQVIDISLEACKEIISACMSNVSFKSTSACSVKFAK